MDRKHDQGEGGGTLQMLKIRSISHWIASGVMAAFLIPGFILAGLPLRISFVTLLGAYWTLLWQSAAVAALLAIVMDPAKNLQEMAAGYWSQKPRIAILAAFSALMLWEFGWLVGLLVIIVGVAAAEWFGRTGGKGAARLLIPVGYCFAGLVMMCCYSAIGASLREPKFDVTFNRLDSRIFGITVAAAVSWAAAHVPLWGFRIAEFVYYNTFPALGAAMTIVGLAKGWKPAVRMVGAVLVAYYLAFAIFLLWPSIGPFTISSSVPESIVTPTVERIIASMASMRWNHITLPVTTEEYIAFPSMHLAVGLLALWFVRKWRRLLAAMLVFNILLVPSILLLEWHYFVDLIGGAMVAALAVWLTGSYKEAA